MWASQQEIQEQFEALTPSCTNCGCNPCCFLCPNSPRYYSQEQEREDTNWNDSLSHSEWMSLAVQQYEQVHGEPYCS